MSTVTPEAEAPTVVSPAKTTSERMEILANAMYDQEQHGWQVESQTGFQVVLVKGRRPKHSYHLVMTILTMGLWGLFVWLPITIFGGEKQEIVEVDEYGNTNIEKVAPTKTSDE